MPNQSLSLTFHGAAGTVTGSKTLLEADGLSILIDCGLFQGLKDLRLRNWEKPAFDPAQVNAVVLTHAHLDHVGYLPLLAKYGFQGKVYATPPTADLAEIILFDSAKLQEEDADFANEKGYSKHHPAKPLYTEDDVKNVLRRFVRVPDKKWIAFSDALRFRYVKSGHILGSAFADFDCNGRRVVFSGDLGRTNPLLLQPPEFLRQADFLVLESTYGDRLHETTPPSEHLERLVNETVKRGGIVIIPSFAVGRAQDLLFLINELKQNRAIPNIRVCLDSPMGIDATNIFRKYPAWHRLSPDKCQKICSDVVMIRDFATTLKTLADRRSKIVIAGSGMLTGGRVLHYLETYLSDPKSMVLLTGFQAPGTRGRLLQDGAHEIKFHGRYLPVLARIENISTLSAHADQQEILQWLRGFEKAPQTVFINHGEAQASQALKIKIQDTLNWRCHVPVLQEKIGL